MESICDQTEKQELFRTISDTGTWPTINGNSLVPRKLGNMSGINSAETPSWHGTELLDALSIIGYDNTKININKQENSEYPNLDGKLKKIDTKKTIYQTDKYRNLVYEQELSDHGDEAIRKTINDTLECNLLINSGDNIKNFLSGTDMPEKEITSIAEYETFFKEALREYILERVDSSKVDISDIPVPFGEDGIPGRISDLRDTKFLKKEYILRANEGLFKKTGFLWQQPNSFDMQFLPHNNPAWIARSFGDESGPTTAIIYATQNKRKREKEIPSDTREYGGIVFWEQGVINSKPILLHPKDLEKNSALSKEWGYEINGDFYLRTWSLPNNNGLEASAFVKSLSLNYQQETLEWLIANVNPEDLSPTFFE